MRTSNQINDKIKAETEAADNAADLSSQLAIDSLVNANTLVEQVTKGRRQLSIEMANEARKLAGEYGIELIDIVPRQIKYSDEMTESVYNRMITDRKQVAQAYRSWGEGKKADWLGRLEKDKNTIESEAYRRSEEIMGAADACRADLRARLFEGSGLLYVLEKYGIV